jgi:O-antigen ligase
VRSWLPSLYFILCLVLGGASAAGLLANMLLQLLAVVILLVAFLKPPSGPLPLAARQLLCLSGAMVALVLAQLVPLPPTVWAELPGRERIAEAFTLLDAPLPWLPVSLAPYATVASFLWLLPALAMLAIALRSGSDGIVRMVWTLAFFVVASISIGALQIAAGERSPLYFYDRTNFGVTVGFFANANHLATLLVTTLPFLAALYARVWRSAAPNEERGVRVITLAGIVVLVFVGLAINGSLAGLGLMIPVALASVILMRRQRGAPPWMVGLLGLIVMGWGGVVMSDRFDNNLISDSASSDQFSRYTTFRHSLTAAADHLPIGSGVGTFVPIYRLHEDLENITTTYINHAHNDYLEVLLETGLPGMLLISLFLIWWIRRALTIWRSAEPLYLARAGTIASAAILVHSSVDYPLRTVAISAVFALCCALMANPRALVQRQRAERSATGPARHLSAD